MIDRRGLADILRITGSVSAYNVKIMFANRFFYFLLAAFIVFLLTVTISLFDSDASPDEASVYDLLLFAGLLVIFYPTVFGIQNDVDTRMIEILFGIPDYRYKVWLARMILVWLIVFAVLLAFAVLSSLALAPVPVFEMVFQLMFPVFLVGALAFMFSTVVRSGNGTAVVMIVIGTAFWIGSGVIARSKWNIFLNPFDVPDDMTLALWNALITQNRLILATGAVLALLFGLLNLQKRERFIQ